MRGLTVILDDMPVNRVRDFEEYLSVQIDSQYGGFVELFNKSLTMTDEVKAALKKLLEEVKSTFKA